MTTYEWTDPKGNRWTASHDAKARDSELARNLEILRLAGEVEKLQAHLRNADTVAAQQQGRIRSLEDGKARAERDYFAVSEDRDRLRREWLEPERRAALEAENIELKAFVNGQAEEIDRLTKLLNPRKWTRAMTDAWHRALPDTAAAFAALLAVDNEGGAR